MSKYGIVYQDQAKRKFESNPEEACKMVFDMSNDILDLEGEVKKLKATISDLQNERFAQQCSISGLTAETARLRGYKERVQETDEGQEPSFDFKAGFDALMQGMTGGKNDQEN